MRSAYKVTRGIKIADKVTEEAQCIKFYQTLFGHNTFQKHMWKLDIPLKMKAFLLRMAQNILPTKWRLSTKGF